MFFCVLQRINLCADEGALSPGLLQIQNLLPRGLCILDLAPRARADVAPHVDHVDRIREVDLPLVHIVQHLLGPGRPDLLVPAVPEQPHADHDIALERQTLLRLQELLLETRTPAKGYDGVFGDHFLTLKVRIPGQNHKNPIPETD